MDRIKTRVVEIDALRGLIMIIMAIDHASFFIRKVHFSEVWGLSIPAYRGWSEFLTRFVTHISPTGFFILMGMGISLSRSKKKTSYYISRGLFILGLHTLFEKHIWNAVVIGTNPSIFRFGRFPGSGGPINYELGVLFALSTALIFWGIMRHLDKSRILIASITIMVLPAFLIGEQSISSPPTLLMQLLFVPWRGNGIFLLYPVFPWIGLCGFGLWLGRQYQEQAPGDHIRHSLILSALGFILFILIKTTGTGSFYSASTLTDPMAFLSVVKYPASPAFITFMTGAFLTLYACFLSSGNGLSTIQRHLSYIGREPLFFYFAHLCLYAYTSPRFPDGASLTTMYGVWLLSLPLLYLSSRLWSSFKCMLDSKFKSLQR